jgi:hypothetical protein
LQSQILAEGEGPLIQDCFKAREFMEDLLNPDKTPHFSFPAGYELLRNVTRNIQQERTKKAAAATKNKVCLFFSFSLLAAYWLPEGHSLIHQEVVCS